MKASLAAMMAVVLGFSFKNILEEKIKGEVEGENQRILKI